MTKLWQKGYRLHELVEAAEIYFKMVGKLKQKGREGK